MGLPRGDDDTVVEQIEAVGDRQRPADLLLDQEHGEALLVGRPAQGAEQALDHLGSKPEGELVDQQRPRAGGQGPSQREDLLLAAREQAGGPVEMVGELGEVGQRAIDAARPEQQVVTG